jgi:uncharacterized membrane protein
MLDQCFVSVNPLVMFVIALIITGFAIWRVFFLYRGEKTAFFLVMLFLTMTAISFIFMPCWAFTVSLVELGLALYFNKQKMQETIVH